MHLLAQISILQLQTLAQGLDCGKGTDGGDGDRGVVGNHAQPGQVLGGKMGAGKDGQDTSTLRPVPERLPGKPDNAFPLHPVGIGDPFQAGLHAGHFQGRTTPGNAPNFADVEGKAPKAPGEMVPCHWGRLAQHARTGHQI